MAYISDLLPRPAFEFRKKEKKINSCILHLSPLKSTSMTQDQRESQVEEEDKWMSEVK